MNNIFITAIGRLILLLLLQLLIINNINLSTYINPYIYVMVLLLLPVNLKPWQSLLAGFSIGLLMDIFSTTPGMHMAACVLLSYSKILFFKVLPLNKEGEESLAPNINTMGYGGFAGYTLLLVFLHHSMLFIVEVYTFSEFPETFKRIVMSTLISSMLIVLGHAAFNKPATEE